MSVPIFLSACFEQTGRPESVLDAMSTVLSDTEITSQENGRIEIEIESGFATALRGAVLSNTYYKAALAVERSMLSKIASAESAQRTQIRGSSTVGGVRETGGNSADKTTKGAAAGVNLSQIIYDGGLSSSNINQATAQSLGAVAERHIVGNDIALEAAQAWIDYWQYQRRLGILRARTSEMDSLMSKMERMANNGLIDRSALDSARRQSLDMSLEEKLLLSGLDEARTNFKRFFHQEVIDVSRPEEIIDLNEARVQAENWREAPALQKLAAEVVVANNSVMIAKSAFKPQARLQAGVSSPMDEQDSTDTTIGVIFEYTFGDGGKRAANLEEAEAGLEAAKLRLDDVQTEFAAEMETALNKLNSLHAALPLVEKKISLSKIEVETARSQLSTGQSNLRQLIDAELENYRAEDKQITLSAEKLTLQFGIAAKTGALGNLISLDSP